MSRYERRMYFDRLCSLKDAYDERSTDDRTAVISIADAIRWAEALLAAPQIVEEPAAEGATDKADQTA